MSVLVFQIRSRLYLKSGSDRIKVQFWVDADRSLKITVDDLLAERTLLENKIVAQLS